MLYSRSALTKKAGIDSANTVRMRPLPEISNALIHQRFAVNGTRFPVNGNVHITRPCKQRFLVGGYATPPWLRTGYYAIENPESLVRNTHDLQTSMLLAHARKLGVRETS
jgi:hypothetical protein